MVVERLCQSVIQIKSNGYVSEVFIQPYLRNCRKTLHSEKLDSREKRDSVNYPRLNASVIHLQHDPVGAIAFDSLSHAPGAARGAKSAAFAGKRHQLLMGALGAAQMSIVLMRSLIQLVSENFTLAGVISSPEI